MRELLSAVEADAEQEVERNELDAALRDLEVAAHEARDQPEHEEEQRRVGQGSGELVKVHAILVPVRGGGRRWRAAARGSSLSPEREVSRPTPLAALRSCMTALKVQELDDYFTPIDNLTSRQKLRRLGRAKEVIGLAFKVVDEYGKGRPTELTKNTHRLSLRLISEAQSLAQAQLVAEGGKVAFERGGVVSPSDRGEDGELLLFDKKNPWWPSSKKIPRK